MAHWAFRVNLILVLILSDYRGSIYMGSYMTPGVLQVNTAELQYNFYIGG